METATHRAIDAIWRIESAKVIAALTRMTRDVSVAEDLAQEALMAALQKWPAQGIPQNPGAWLMSAAKHRAVDLFRRDKLVSRKREELAVGESEEHTPDLEGAIDEDVGDDLLRLILICCHPVLSKEARVTLTLRLLGSLTTEEIARAFLVPEPAIQQRVVRAKKALSEANAPFEVPRGAELTERLASVLEVIYLIFNEGYSATSGDDWMRPELCHDALRLGRILTGLVPTEAEAHGLVALMELQASRLGARTTAAGEPILLLDQNRALWNQLLVHRGLASLLLAERLADQRGAYTLQAAIAACHARARRAEETEWPKIAALYTALFEQLPSPVIQLNRAVAIGMAFGPAVGLRELETVGDSLSRYHPMWAARADLLAKLGRHTEARAAFEKAAELTANEREKQLLRRRAAELG